MTSFPSNCVTSHESCVSGFPWEALGSDTTEVPCLYILVFWLLSIFSHLDMYPWLYPRSSGSLCSHFQVSPGLFNVLSGFFNDILLLVRFYYFGNRISAKPKLTMLLGIPLYFCFFRDSSLIPWSSCFCFPVQELQLCATTAMLFLEENSERTKFSKAALESETQKEKPEKSQEIWVKTQS